ncbi:MAG: CotH kinase family protein [Spirochaetales bacterium]|nr:CotH kinase family protein [Spirochaetales bacterium]
MPREKMEKTKEQLNPEQIDEKALKESIQKNNYIPDGYEVLFTHGNLHDIEIVMTESEWDGLLSDMKTYAQKDWDKKGLTGNYRQADFKYKGPLGEIEIDEIGFRTKGHYTRPLPRDTKGLFHRAHFKIKFNKPFDEKPGTIEDISRNERRFCSLRELELRVNLQDTRWDNSQIRELFCYDLLQKAGVYTSRTGSAKLTIHIGRNKHYFGIHTLIEPIDKSFLTQRFGKKGNDGNLYKCLWGDSGPATLEPLDSKFTGNVIFSEKRVIGIKDWKKHYRPTYDLKTNKQNPEHKVLHAFIKNLNKLKGQKLKEYLETHFETDRFLRYQAMNVLVGKWDDYWAMGNNYYLYFNNTGKIDFFPNDYDMSLGGGFALFDTATIGIYEWGNRCKSFLKLVAPSIPPFLLNACCEYTSPLSEKIFEIPEYRKLYEQYLKEFITPENKLFLYSEYEKKFDMMHELYLPYLSNDMGEGFVMVNEYGTKVYFRNKTKSIIKQLGLNEAEYEIF